MFQRLTSEMFGNVRVALGKFLSNRRKYSESGRNQSENRSLSVCLRNK